VDGVVIATPAIARFTPHPPLHVGGITPRVGTLAGGSAVTVTGGAFGMEDVITCLFGDVVVAAAVVSPQPSTTNKPSDTNHEPHTLNSKRYTR